MKRVFVDANVFLRFFTKDDAGQHARAAKLFRRVVENSSGAGSPAVAYEVGKLYASGAGVPQDFVEAYKWFNLAATDPVYYGHGDVVDARNAVAAKMTPAQIAEAQQRSTAWVERR